MSIYSTKLGKRVTGQKRKLIFVKDKYRVSRTNVPADILKRLKAGEKDIEYISNEIIIPPKVCLFCKKPSKMTRFVNGKTVVLCDEHYHSVNIGQIAQQLRENNYGQSAQSQARQEPVYETERQGEETPAALS